MLTLTSAKLEARLPIVITCRKRSLMTLAAVCWRMPGRAITAPCLHMDKLAVESPTLWLAMVQTKVNVLSLPSCNYTMLLHI